MIHTMPMHPLHRLGYLLVELPDHRRAAIASDCQLLGCTTAALIQSARDTGKLKELWEAAAKFRGDDTPNPFV